MSEAIKQPVSPEGIIQMQGVNKWYGQFHVLKDINLNVKQGERIVLCGPSGSGKSTTHPLPQPFGRAPARSHRGRRRGADQRPQADRGDPP
ncbi:ABC-type glutathione transport system ATPase component [Pseudomonas sp. W4I3]|nr:ABC-type glutathione transport system ATPase component [Pseudomonas sp. W4I3]